MENVLFLVVVCIFNCMSSKPKPRRSRSKSLTELHSLCEELSIRDEKLKKNATAFWSLLESIDGILEKPDSDLSVSEVTDCLREVRDKIIKSGVERVQNVRCESERVE